MRCIPGSCISNDCISVSLTYNFSEFPVLLKGRTLRLCTEFCILALAKGYIVMHDLYFSIKYIYMNRTCGVHYTAQV